MSFYRLMCCPGSPGRSPEFCRAVCRADGCAIYGTLVHLAKTYNFVWNTFCRPGTPNMSFHRLMCWQGSPGRSREFCRAVCAADGCAIFGTRVYHPILRHFYTIQFCRPGTPKGCFHRLLVLAGTPRATTRQRYPPGLRVLGRRSRPRDSAEAPADSAGPRVPAQQSPMAVSDGPSTLCPSGPTLGPRISAQLLLVDPPLSALCAIPSPKPLGVETPHCCHHSPVRCPSITSTVTPV
jgi:hypothetical protein